MMNELKELWRQHQAMSFPEGMAREEIEGEDLVSLDSFTAGCISTFVARSGTLDSERTECLVRCREGLARVLPKLTGDAEAYYRRLHVISELALQALGR
jgi:hypothetical protein